MFLLTTVSVGHTDFRLFKIYVRSNRVLAVLLRGILRNVNIFLSVVFAAVLIIGLSLNIIVKYL
jgi:hypothetical protein